MQCSNIVRRVPLNVIKSTSLQATPSLTHRDRTKQASNEGNLLIIVPFRVLLIVCHLVIPLTYRLTLRRHALTQSTNTSGTTWSSFTPSVLHHRVQATLLE